MLARRFFRLTIPNILSNVTVPLAGLADTVMLGHLPEIRFLAGVALGSIIFDYVYWTFGFLRMGTTGMTAQAYGRQDETAAFLILYRSIVLAVIIAALLLATQHWIAAASFTLLSGTGGTEAAARDYFFARIWGAPAALANFVVLGWFLGRERSDYALYLTIVANLGNIVLNYIFLYKLHLAAFGAGLATMLSQYLMLGTGVLLLLRYRKPAFPGWREVLSRRKLVELLRLNVDLLIRTFCLITSFAVFINISAILGVQVLAANAILQRLQSLAAYLIDGAAFATESLAGIFHGQNDRSQLHGLLRFALLVGAGFAGLFILLLVLAPAGFYGLFTSHAPVVDLVRVFVPQLAITLVFGSLAYMYDGFFIGLTQGRVLRNSMLVSTLLVFIPLASVAYAQRSNAILWLAMTLFMVARAGTLWWASRRMVEGSY